MSKRTFVPDKHKRVEKRRRKNLRNVKEQILMEEKAKERITFWYYGFRPPKPNDKVADLIVSFSKPVKKSDLYPKLAEALGEHWNGEPTRRVFLHLSNPPKWRETRKIIKTVLEELLL